MSSKKTPKLLFISSSGGHFEQLKMLKPLMKKYNSCVITEKVLTSDKADYYMIQISHTDKLLIFKFVINFILALRIWVKERPKVIISTGSMIVIPFAVLAKLTGKKIIFIETFAKIKDPTKTGRLMYKFADLFIIQWESLRKYYPNAVYGGSIY
ncbi:UNVERIFIED_CONTAM: UDP-N-acetylglucosamine:LPS N-acetylglucosamine transferase [Acetivibrio alkalicellulosi]